MFLLRTADVIRSLARLLPVSITRLCADSGA